MPTFYCRRQGDAQHQFVRAVFDPDAGRRLIWITPGKPQAQPGVEPTSLSRLNCEAYFYRTAVNLKLNLFHSFFLAAL
jgi:hypothetical protein